MPQPIFAVLDLFISFRSFRGRYLPAPGGLGDQPAPLWEAFEMLERLWNEDSG